MNILLWILQALAALLYGASGIMKISLHVRQDKQGGAILWGVTPGGLGMALGSLELVCVVGG